MIQPQDGKRGGIDAHHGVQRLTDTLAVLSMGQLAQQQRDTQSQAHLTTLTTCTRRLVGAVVGLTLSILGLCGLIAWQDIRQPELAYVRALEALDATLGQQWPQLPQPTQEALSTTYTRLGLTPPGQRK